MWLQAHLDGREGTTASHSVSFSTCGRGLGCVHFFFFSVQVLAAVPLKGIPSEMEKSEPPGKKEAFCDPGPWQPAETLWAHPRFAASRRFAFLVCGFPTFFDITLSLCQPP